MKRFIYLNSIQEKKMGDVPVQLVIAAFQDEKGADKHLNS